MLKPNGNGFNSYYTFTDPSGTQPHHGHMLLVGNKIYRTSFIGADGGGELFSVNPDGTGYTTLHVFEQATGWQPHSGVILGASRLVFGVTSAGGDNNGGVLYSYNLGNGDYKVLYSFGGNATGFDPHDELEFDSTGRWLLGMTRQGGAFGDGTIFRIAPYARDPASTYADVYSLNSASTTAAGFQDHGTLLRVGQVMYGLTQFGGAQDKGTLFAINQDGSNLTLFHSFADPTVTNDGKEPYGSLVYVQGVLYGMTRDGGANGLGSIFCYSTRTGAYRQLFSFDYTSGVNPIDDLTPNQSGTLLFGQTQAGGANDPTGALGYGTIFSLVLKPTRMPPTITLQPVSLTVFAGRNATFTTLAAGSRPLRYQWQKNGVNVPGANQARYALFRVTSADAGTYRVLVTNPVSTIASANVTLTVN
jgi:uncharacterized repeat protein (TIGR03803 family)